MNREFIIKLISLAKKLQLFRLPVNLVEQPEVPLRFRDILPRVEQTPPRLTRRELQAHLARGGDDAERVRRSHNAWANGILPGRYFP
jgi:hypothetical protein